MFGCCLKESKTDSDRPSKSQSSNPKTSQKVNGGHQGQSASPRSPTSPANNNNCKSLVTPTSLVPSETTQARNNAALSDKMAAGMESLVTRLEAVVTRLESVAIRGSGDAGSTAGKL